MQKLFFLGFERFFDQSDSVDFLELLVLSEAVAFGALVDKDLRILDRTARFDTEKDGNGFVSLFLAHILAVEFGIGRLDVHIEEELQSLARDGQFDELKSALIDGVELLRDPR